MARGKQFLFLEGAGDSSFPHSLPAAAQDSLEHAKLCLFLAVLSPPVHLDFHLSVSRTAAHTGTLPEDCRTDGFCFRFFSLLVGERQTGRC